MSRYNPQLATLGWDPDFEHGFAAIAEAGDIPARVIADHGAEFLVHDGTEVTRAVAARRPGDSPLAPPAVGDWVALVRSEAAVIRAIVARRTVLSRKAASIAAREQVIAANADVAFVVATATDINQRRIERYLTIGWQSGASPVVLLTKADLTDAAGSLRESLESVALGTPVVVTSSRSGEGIPELERMLQPARTAVLMGPSGTGKSSLINRIMGAPVMRTADVHRSGEGRHMTSHRQLIQLPSGGMIIDTPGLREAQLWEGDEALAAVFDDIEGLAAQCRFPDCAHQTEPECAVKAALADGTLDPFRLSSYLKLGRELRAVAARNDARLRADERRKWKRIATANRSRERYLRR